jgi:copper chaperone
MGRSSDSDTVRQAYVSNPNTIPLKAIPMTIEFQVEGMSCQHCVTAVTNAIREHDAGAQVRVDLASGRVTVDSAQPVDLLKAAIDEAGYTVTAVASGTATGGAAR